MNSNDHESERKTFTDQRIDEAERIIAEDAAELERLKKEFFIQGTNDSVDENDPLKPPAAPPATKVVRRRQKRGDATIDALQQFVRVLEAADGRSRHAAICWLADKYLGVNVYDH